MIDQNSRPARKVGIADHLWETYEDMAQQMGSDRDALINQALFLFARLYGFIDSKPGRTEAMMPLAPLPGASASASPARATAPSRPSSSPVLASVSSGARAREDAAAGTRTSARTMETSVNGAESDARREAERVLETADALERLLRSKDEPSREGPEQQDPSSRRAAESMDGTAAASPILYLSMDGVEPQRIIKDRYVIGRGKHCDLVINSGKVSREHAVILREGVDFYIEDLGSSNGTWFNKQRIKRRKVDDGDEYFICSERIRLNFR